METTQNNSEQNMNILQMIHNDLVNHLFSQNLPGDLGDLVLPSDPQCRHSAQPIPAAAASPQPALANPRAAATGAGDRGCGCRVSSKSQTFDGKMMKKGSEISSSKHNILCFLLKIQSLLDLRRIS